MKQKNFAKILMLVLLASVVMCSTMIFAGAEGEQTTPTIIGKNVEYTDKMSIMIAVDSATVDADAKLVVTAPNGSEATYYNYEVSTDSGVAGAYVFTVDGIPASAIGDEFTFTVKSGDKESLPFTYSLAEYFYERLYSDGFATATEGRDAARKTFYESYLANGAAAQELFRNYDKSGNYVGGTTLVTDYTVLAVEKGTLANGKEVILSTEAITSTVSANAALAADKSFTGKWTVTTYGETETAVTIANGEEASAVAGEVTVATPVYSDATGDFYKNDAIAGKRYDYDTDGTKLFGVDNANFATTEIANGSLVFSRKPGTEGEAYINFSDLNSKNNVFVFEADTRFSGFSKGTTVIKIRFQLGGIDEQINIQHSGSTITIAAESGTGSVKISENEWCNIRFELNITDRTYNIFVDNEYKGTIKSNRTNTGGSARVLYYLLKDGFDGVIEFDNIYYGFVAEGTAIPQN